ncbi:MAG: HAD family phosphatase [Lachnospiraceae bacterium]|nr:HAD family phosphatase [Lachnospiraceae bacterium]
MIKVIASDMDGTLLNNHHAISEKTKQVIRTACDKGFRFMIITGRNFVSAWQELKYADFTCDYIVSSGAEIRNPDKESILKINIPIDDCKFVNEVMEKNSIGGMYCTEDRNYMVGTKEEVEKGILAYIHFFHSDLGMEDLKQTRLYKQMGERTKEVPSFEELLSIEKNITKIFLVDTDYDKLKKIKKELEVNSDLAVTSSFINNLEITNIKAQKGPILKEYIESLGYSMDEVMVLGDSLNDYSMMCMDFGATVAMENADEEIKAVAKYITRSNEEDGVAYTIEEMMKKYGML